MKTGTPQPRDDVVKGEFDQRLDGYERFFPFLELFLRTDVRFFHFIVLVS